MSEATDQRLRRAIAGDRAAVSELLAEHGPAIERALQISPKWSAVLEPADVMQVTYLEAFTRIRQFDPKLGEFPTWLRRIAENNLRDAIRGLEREKRPQPTDRIQPADGDSVSGLYDLLGVTTTDPEPQVRRRNELLAALESSLVRLPPDYAIVIRQYDLDGQSIDAVAAGMNRSTAAIHMLRARAHDRLRDLLGPAFTSISALG